MLERDPSPQTTAARVAIGYASPPDTLSAASFGQRLAAWLIDSVLLVEASDRHAKG